MDQDSEILNEKRPRTFLYTLLGLLVATIIVSACVLSGSATIGILSDFDYRDDTFSDGANDSKGTVSNKNDISTNSSETKNTKPFTQESQGDGTELGKVEERTLAGAIIALGSDKSYIRLSVKNEGIYSVGITANTKITQNGAAVSLAALEPLAEVAVTATRLSDKERFDFRAESMEISGGRATQTIEERIANLPKTTVVGGDAQ